MCGACGGGRAGPAWEDVAGRLDGAGIRARAQAVQRLTTGTRWRVTPWHGSWVVGDAAGRRRHAPDLDAVFRLLPPLVAVPAPGDDREDIAEASPPPGWDVQAGLVWVAAARAAGARAQLTLPSGDGPGLAVAVGPDAVVAHPVVSDGRVVVRAPSALPLLESLIATASTTLVRERPSA